MGKNKIKCILCDTEAIPFNELRGKKYYNCPVCKSIFMDPADYLSQKEEEERYCEHNNDVYDPRYQEFVSPIVNAVQSEYQPEQIGLDYGCGTGPVISKMLRDNGYQIEQYDPFFAYNPDKLKIKYDYIVCCEVMEHFHHPANEFRRLYSLLNPGGAIFFKTKIYADDISFETWYYKNDPTHVFFYKRETLEWIQNQLGFSEMVIDKRFIKFML